MKSNHKVRTIHSSHGIVYYEKNRPVMVLCNTNIQAFTCKYTLLCSVHPYFVSLTVVHNLHSHIYISSKSVSNLSCTLSDESISLVAAHLISGVCKVASFDRYPIAYPTTVFQPFYHTGRVPSMNKPVTLL